MSIRPFRFKQFEIYQDKTAMKVGTDGVLLGAWSNLQSGNKILDIGTGTGLIALMLAQRFPESYITAIELDDDAFHQAIENFTNSKFSNQICGVNSSLQSFSSDQKFDLIVSNPPFFILNDRVDFDARKQARQQETLTFEDLLFHTANLLTTQGTACFIIPYDLEDNFIALAAQHNLYPNEIVHVKGNINSLIKRSLINLSFTEKDKSISELIIEVERHQYTNAYINLTKDFYLKM